MNKRSQNALDDYFTSMLLEEAPRKDVPSRGVKVVTIEKPKTAQVKQLHIPLSTLPETLVFEEVQKTPAPLKKWENITVDDEFQALFFSVADLNFAVPLISLGGIHELTEEPNKILGKPSWFTGVLNYQEVLFNIVDTADWLNSNKIKKSKDYSHFICLEKSNWAISCESLIGAKILKKSEVKWRDKAGRNPWLAGIVKNKKCVLLHVPEFIKLLEKGQDINDFSGMTK